jgi:purine-binding chemotaxis protein CheW
VLSQVTASIEDTLEGIVAGHYPLNAERSAWLCQVVDHIEHNLEGLLSGTVSEDDLVNAVSQLLGRCQETPAASPVPSAHPPAKPAEVDAADCWVDTWQEGDTVEETTSARLDDLPMTVPAHSSETDPSEATEILPRNFESFPLLNTGVDGEGIHFDMLVDSVDAEIAAQAAAMQENEAQAADVPSEALGAAGLSEISATDVLSETPVADMLDEVPVPDALSETLVDEVPYAAMATEPAADAGDEATGDEAIDAELDPQAETSVVAGALDALMSTIDSEVQQVYGYGAAELRQLVSLDSTSTTERYLLFTLAGCRYAVSVPNVIEVGRVPVITPVPNVPAWLRGVINLRGEILSIIDVRRFLEIDDAYPTESSRMLVIKSVRDEIMTSLIVDQVNGFARLSKAHMDVSIAPLRNKVTAYVSAVCEHDEQTVAVLDLERFLLSPEICQFNEA